MNHKEVFVFIVTVLLLILLMQNTQVATIRFLFLKVAMSQIILVFLAAFLGFLIGYLVAKKKI